MSEILYLKDFKGFTVLFPLPLPGEVNNTDDTS